MYQFLDLHLPTTAIYPSLLARLTTQSDKFLDIGCCFGQEIRQLILDGVPSANTYGGDRHSGFFDVGYDLFRDRESLHPTTFIAADVFDDASALVTELAGKVDVIYAGALFHLFRLD